MTACEPCWNEAYRQSRMLGGSQVDYYLKLLETIDGHPHTAALADPETETDRSEDEAMSYDVSLMLEGDGVTTDVWCRNHTSNTAVMWREAGCDIATFHGAGAGTFRVALEAAIADIEARPGHYAQWNPPNKWGSVDSTLEFLRDLQDGCRRFPDATVLVCR